MVILFALLALSLFTWLGLVKATLSEQADLHEIPVPEIDLDQFHGFSKDALKSFPQPEQQP